jgi:beta-phosphoglucomutase
LTLAIEAVLWDLDGVIVDTDIHHYQSWISVLPRYGLTLSPELHKQTFGMNNAQILRLISSDGLTAKEMLAIGMAKEAHFRVLVAHGLQPMAGVENWLGCFENWGLRQAIASSAPMDNIMAILNTLQLIDYFQAIVSGHDLLAKPDPAVYREAAARIDVAAQHCLVIEDALVGVAGAQAAGMRVIAVATTFSAAELEHADIVLDSLDQLDPAQLGRLEPC